MFVALLASHILEHTAVSSSFCAEPLIRACPKSMLCFILNIRYITKRLAS